VNSPLPLSLPDDLSTAQAIQKRLLPHDNLTFGDLQFKAYYRPFRSIGGDYYDFVPLDRNRLGFAIGDVSGKGVGAALIMASLQASLRARLLDQGTKPSTLIRSLSQLLYECSLPEVYATLFYGEFNAEMRVLTYVNAGHNPPLVLRQEKDRVRILRLESEGPPVGAFPDAVYQSRRCALQPHDLLVAYTDGITETSNQVQEHWGSARLEAILSTCIGKRPAEIIAAILKALESFASPVVVGDDMTLVVATVEQSLTTCAPRQTRYDTTPMEMASEVAASQSTGVFSSLTRRRGALVSQPQTAD
jgi:sigma-B regulation protein RsbU (phosphoserine phosphatase)